MFTIQTCPQYKYLETRYAQIFPRCHRKGMKEATTSFSYQPTFGKSYRKRVYDGRWASACQSVDTEACPWDSGSSQLPARRGSHCWCCRWWGRWHRLLVSSASPQSRASPVNRHTQCTTSEHVMCTLYFVLPATAVQCGLKHGSNVTNHRTQICLSRDINAMETWHKCDSEVVWVWQWSGMRVTVRWYECDSEVVRVWQWSGTSVTVKWHECDSEVVRVWQWGGTSVTVRWYECDSEVVRVWQWGGRSVTVRWYECDSEVVGVWQWGGRVWQWGGTSVTVRWHKCDSEVAQVWQWGGRSVTVRWHKCYSEVAQVWQWGGTSVTVKWHKCYSEVAQVLQWSGTSVTVRWHMCDSEVAQVWQWWNECYREVM